MTNADGDTDTESESESGTALDHQPLPSETRCPECGAKPTEESVTRRKLSTLGYKHEDIFLECAAEGCETDWICGVPIGDFDREEQADDLWCDACDETWMLVHRVRLMTEQIELHLKCPNEECNTFGRALRDLDQDRRIALVGYPQITGDTQGCDPYGWVADPAAAADSGGEG